MVRVLKFQIYGCHAYNIYILFKQIHSKLNIVRDKAIDFDVLIFTNLSCSRVYIQTENHTGPPDSGKSCHSLVHRLDVHIYRYILALCIPMDILKWWI